MTANAHDSFQPFAIQEVSRAAVAENLALLAGRLGGGTRLCPVVKADCYGHGLDVLMPVFVERADALAVAQPVEAFAARQFGWPGPLLVLFPPFAAAGRRPVETFAELIAQQATLTVTEADQLDLLAAAARQAGRDADVHIKIDTGMSRSGSMPDRAADLARQVRATAGLNLTGLYSHMATADESDPDGRAFAGRQREQFIDIVGQIGGREELTLHLSNSAGVIDLPDTHLDMVRPGIAVYGYPPSDQLEIQLPFRPAMRVRSWLTQVRDLPAGATCGYGRTYRFEKPARAGLVPIGYGDGYLRALSNRSSMRVAGVDCPVRGRVSMDQVILDLTDAPASAGVGEPVEVVSDDPAAPHSVVNLARLAGTISYEITCALGGQRIARQAAEGP